MSLPCSSTTARSSPKARPSSSICRPEARRRPAPPAGTLNGPVQEWPTFIGTEIQRVSALFRPDAAADWKTAARANLDRRLGFADQACRLRLPDR